MISPSKIAVKAWILGAQTAGLLQQTIRNTIRCTVTVNIESCIKLTDFSQRFAVLLAQRLQTRSVLRSLCLKILETMIRHSADAERQQSKQPSRNTVRKQTIYSINVCSTNESHNSHANYPSTRSPPSTDVANPSSKASLCL